MSFPPIFTIDLNFQNTPGTIAAYLIPHRTGGILVETGPGSTLPALLSGLEQHGILPAQITDVLLTHIHLDHGGAAGWWAKQGARIHVHPSGAPHLINPEKLLNSARRIYGDQMQALWGDFLPVPEAQLHPIQDGETIPLDGLSIQSFHVPGHATHHIAYILADACFAGDIGGIRVFNQPFISLPMPPPDLDLSQWRQSILRLQALRPSRIVPTHFGVFEDAEWHLAKELATLDEITEWIEANLPRQMSVDGLRIAFACFETERMQRASLNPAAIEAHHVANPTYISADGIQRYWKKLHPAPASG